jgi:hypothetical protein
MKHHFFFLTLITFVGVLYEKKKITPFVEVMAARARARVCVWERERSSVDA